MARTAREKRKGLSGGKKFGPPPKKGPIPQGIKVFLIKRKNKKNCDGIFRRKIRCNYFRYGR